MLDVGNKALCATCPMLNANLGVECKLLGAGCCMLGARGCTRYAPHMTLAARRGAMRIGWNIQ